MAVVAFGNPADADAGRHGVTSEFANSFLPAVEGVTDLGFP